MYTVHTAGAFEPADSPCHGCDWNNRSSSLGLVSAFRVAIPVTLPPGLAEDAVRVDHGTPLTRQALKADRGLCQRRANELIVLYADVIAAAPKQMVFVFDLVGGDYVCAMDRWDALDAFDAKFGETTTHGWVHAPHNPLFVGGGLGYIAG